MILENYKSKLSDALVGRTFWASIAVLLVLSNLMLSYFVVNADTSEKTVVEPIGNCKQFWVQGEELDAEYIEIMGLFYLDLYTDYHPENVDGRFEMILKYSDPTSYGTLKAKLDSEKKRIKRAQLSSTFFPTSVNTGKNIIYIQGILTPIVAGKSLKPVLDATFSIEFKYKNNRLFIDKLARVIKTQTGEYIDYE